MKKTRILSLLLLACLALSLTACGGGEAPMTQEEYLQEMETLTTDLNEAMASLSGLSAADEDSFREGIQTVRDMAEPFRTFAAIQDPPEEWEEAHATIAQGCTSFADALEGMCDSAEELLDGAIDTAAYEEAVTGYITDLTEAAALLTQGFSSVQG